MVPAVVFDGTAAEAELWRIGENLMREELTDLERAEQIARRIGLTEEQKQTAQVAPPDANRYHKRGIRQVARELGIERRTIQRNFTLGRGHYHWRHETCWYAVRDGKAGHWQGGRKQSTVWEIANNNPFGNRQREQSPWSAPCHT